VILSANIMAHPARRPFVDELRDQLGDIPVIWDEKQDRWDTGRRALLAHLETGAKWGLTIQDDAIPCKHLLTACRKAARAAGERPVGLYVGKVRPHQHTVTPAVRRARREGTPWIEMEGPWWGVAIIVPTVHIPELVRWGDRNRRVANYDRRTAAWYAGQGIKCWYTVPSLVDHRSVDENPSLIPGRTGNRRAHYFVGDGDPRQIDWTIPPLRVSPHIVFRHASNGRIVNVHPGSPRHRRLSRQSVWVEEEAA
jgi:hypothetical protein